MKIKRLFQISILILSIIIASACSSSPYSEYYVSPEGSDENPGTESKPFRTISFAAEKVQPGDTVTVKGGIYREWVSPKRGGNSELTRITFRAAKGEDVYLLGSERAKNWKKDSDGLYMFSVDSSFFGEFNPFNTLTRHPIPIEIDESGDGWGWLKYGRWTHLGDVVINGEGLTEKETLKEVKENKLTWYTKTETGKTTIWANFGETNPNEAEVEINARPYAFFPEEPGLNYVTLNGFTIMNVANHWAPPVPYQPAAVGVNGGHHWVIENNIIMYAKAAAISIGNPTGEVNRDSTGHHIIRNNVILRCGQGGITGQFYNNYSQIYNNHIEDINYRKEFGGWETAAIKHHNGKGLVIRNNFIRGVFTVNPEIGAAHGIWNDFKNENWRVTGNVIMGCESAAILAEANWEGPNLYENNVFVGGNVATYSSRGDNWVHNILVNSDQQMINQDWGQRITIRNIRWYNNVFIGDGLETDFDITADSYRDNVYFNGAVPHEEEEKPVIIKEKTEFVVEEKEDGVYLNFSAPDKFLNSKVELIKEKTLYMDFSFDSSIKTDFFNNQRTEKNNLAGPFVNLKAGKNSIQVYKYTDLYKKALSLIGKK